MKRSQAKHDQDDQDHRGGNGLRNGLGSVLGKGLGNGLGSVLEMSENSGDGFYSYKSNNESVRCEVVYKIDSNVA